MRPKKTWLKRVGIALGSLLLLLVVVGGGWAIAKARAYDASMEKVYDVPAPAVVRSSDPVIVARGKHLVEATTGCATTDCHGADLAGGRPIAMGPVGTFRGPNLTPGGVLDSYSDAELARLVRHGVKKDGRSVRFMPSQDFSWLPDGELTALVSYLRTVPAVQRDPGTTEVGFLGKVLDQKGDLVIDVARRIDHSRREEAPAPAANAEYGKLLARACSGCHGTGYSGGAIPGAPSSVPVPSNLTPHPSGMQGWSFEDFDAVLSRGVKKSGGKLDPFMPIEAFGKLDAVEKRALFAYLSSLPPRPFGQR